MATSTEAYTPPAGAFSGNLADSPYASAGSSNGAHPPLLVPIAPTDPGYARTKRATDVLLSAIALIVLAPIFLCIAFAIRLTSGRPVIYKQTRLGLGGRPFTLYKFRTMEKDADSRKTQLHALNETDGPIFKMKRDPRITPLGAKLRRCSIDEFPQLFNVLRGSMSLVGPRPLPVNEVEQGDWRQVHRISVKPGITGLWQVSGRSELGFEDWIVLDHEYIANRSTWYDVKLLILTFPAVLSGKGAY